ncbi:hypothetical protein [Bacteroides fluxus]|jgi:uncharacterized membrane protein
MNIKLSNKGQRILKIIHLICVIAWVGSAIIMNVLRHLVTVKDASGMYYMAEILEAVDMKILVPGAIVCLFTGLVYSVCTSWGFVKHRWIAVKWILTILMIVLGTFFMGPLIKENTLIGSNLMEGQGNADIYWENVAVSAKWGAFQLCMLTFTIIISVIKPWKKGKK